MIRRRTASTAIAILALAFTVSACDGADSDIPAATSPSATPTPSETTPTWAAEFTSEEIAEYDKALARWTEAEKLAEPLRAEGKATAASQEVFREYWIAWQGPYYQLQNRERIGIRVSGLAEVLWSKPVEVQISKSGATVKIDQCIDPATVTVEIPKDAKTDGVAIDYPYIRSISMHKSQGKPYRVGEFGDASVQNWENKPCDKSS